MVGAVFVAALALVVAFLIVVGERAFERQRQADAGRVQQVRVLLAAERVVKSFQDVQRGERGYLLTRDPSFLEPYHIGRSELETHLRELAKLTHASAVQERRFAQLRTVIDEGLRNYGAVVEMVRRGELQSASDTVAQGRGKASQDRAREILQLIIAEEERTLAETLDAQRQAARESEVVLWALGGLGALLLAGAATVGAVALRAISRAGLIEALELERDRAEASSRAKSEFLANMSHELRTPLNGVVGVASVLGGTRLDPKQREMVGVIESSAVTLEHLLSDILDLARVESGKLEIRSEPFHLGSCIRAATALAEMQAREKGLSFSLTLPPDAECVVEGDHLRLRQVWTNLLSNAVKFTHQGEVAFRVRPGGEGPTRTFTFEVQDTGVGFDQATGARLFTRLEQADGSITRRYGGSGLGLAISRSLSELMGGELTAVSAPGRGSTFTLTLPLLQPLAPARQAA
ncbi:MAG: CHASE3 domain-containing protein [Proteobacteria bacterium]|nr:CHASE3 domain-containing protein [Pseudomonadota bacterium]